MKINFYKYLIISIILILITEITNKVLNIKGLIYNSLAEQLTSQQIESVFEFQEKWQWVNYIIIPIVILIKTSIIASILYIGSFFFSKIEVKFKQLLTIVLKAEFIFLGIGILKILWFYFYQTDYNLKDIQYFFPFSALNIIGYQGLEPWFIYPLQTFNFFEIAYIIYLGFQIGNLTNTNADNGLKIVACSYIPALVLWVSIIMFLTLNYS